MMLRTTLSFPNDLMARNNPNDLKNQIQCVTQAANATSPIAMKRGGRSRTAVGGLRENDHSCSLWLFRPSAHRFLRRRAILAQ